MNNNIIYNDMLITDKINLNLNYDINIDEILKNVSNKMFHLIENTPQEKDVDIKEDSLKNTNSQNVPRFLKFVDYNKFNSKYNEKVKFIELTDELFWLFYKLYYQQTDEDLLYKNLFLEEKSKKIELVQIINKKK